MIGLNKKTHTERRTPSWMILPKILLKLYSIQTKVSVNVFAVAFKPLV